jgi:hypothetical protein
VSHQIIIGLGKDGGGFAATTTTVTGSLVWTPSHELSPAQERHRIEKAQEMMSRAQAMLDAPASAPTE